jgi:hypothetical protein
VLCQRARRGQVSPQRRCSDTALSTCSGFHNTHFRARAEANLQAA